MLLCCPCVSSCVYDAPRLGPFGRTPLALHCTECSSRGASAIPLGGCRLYSRAAEKSSSRKLRFRQGESELLLLAAQSILYAIYHSLTFFFFLGELFYRLGRDINCDERFVAYHPA